MMFLFIHTLTTSSTLLGSDHLNQFIHLANLSQLNTLSWWTPGQKQLQPASRMAFILLDYLPRQLHSRSRKNISTLRFISPHAQNVVTLSLRIWFRWETGWSQVRWVECVRRLFETHLINFSHRNNLCVADGTKFCFWLIFWWTCSSRFAPYCVFKVVNQKNQSNELILPSTKPVYPLLFTASLITV